jgi:hypothetical protein
VPKISAAQNWHKMAHGIGVRRATFSHRVYGHLTSRKNAVLQDIPICEPIGASAKRKTFSA